MRSSRLPYVSGTFCLSSIYTDFLLQSFRLVHSDRLCINFPFIFRLIMLKFADSVWKLGNKNYYTLKIPLERIESDFRILHIFPIRNFDFSLLSACPPRFSFTIAVCQQSFHGKVVSLRNKFLWVFKVLITGVRFEGEYMKANICIQIPSSSVYLTRKLTFLSFSNHTHVEQDLSLKYNC